MTHIYIGAFSIVNEMQFISTAIAHPLTLVVVPVLEHLSLLFILVNELLLASNSAAGWRAKNSSSSVKGKEKLLLKAKQSLLCSISMVIQVGRRRKFLLSTLAFPTLLLPAFLLLPHLWSWLQMTRCSKQRAKVGVVRSWPIDDVMSEDECLSSKWRTTPRELLARLLRAPPQSGWTSRSRAWTMHTRRPLIC